MRVVIFGQKWLAVEVLRQLSLLPRVTVGGVCPDTSGDRLEEEARLCGIPVFSLEDVPPCDLGVAAYCQRYLPAVVRARCGLGILAYHPSLLPRHRGATPSAGLWPCTNPWPGGRHTGWTTGRILAPSKPRTGVMSCLEKRPQNCGGGSLLLWGCAC